MSRRSADHAQHDELLRRFDRRAGCNGVEATIVLLAAILASRPVESTSSPGRDRGHAVQGLKSCASSAVYLASGIASVRMGASLRLASADHAGLLIVWMVWVRTLPRTTDAGRPIPAASGGTRDGVA